MKASLVAVDLIERARVASVTVGEKITETAEKHPDIHMIVEDLMGMKSTSILVPMKGTDPVIMETRIEDTQTTGNIVEKNTKTEKMKGS